MGISPEYHPKPAKNFIPEWYKDTESYINGEKKLFNGGKSGTIKRCMPVFDVITAGYIIPTFVDLYVEQKDGGMFFHTSSSVMQIEGHPKDQAPIHPKEKNVKFAYPKLMNPWSIKTPKGYSCLFTTPKHHENEYIAILDGIVDTDNFTPPVNFPFVFNDPNFEGMIPAGTPLVQVIPFKRDEWKMSFGNNIEIDEANITLRKHSTKWFDAYKTMFWDKKSFN